MRAAPPGTGQGNMLMTRQEQIERDCFTQAAGTVFVGG